jgi:3,4-dihydroxyphenylacetate 2,3-dioxygenase
VGAIVGAAIVSHHPGLSRPKEERIKLGNGQDSDLIAGFGRVRSKMDQVSPDTLIVFDTHWFTTMRHIIAGADRYTGTYTSAELPWIEHDIPYDFHGAPELAERIGFVAEQRGIPFFNMNDPHVEPEYASVNVLKQLGKGEKVLRVGICQNAKPHHFLQMGEAIGEAVKQCDCRVVLLGSGALSHRMNDLDFKPRNPCNWHPDNISDPSHVVLDREVIDLWANGDHASVIDRYPELRKAAYEGLGGHYLQLVGAVGGREFKGRGTAMSDYENALGTANIHIWFDVNSAGKAS